MAFDHLTQSDPSAAFIDFSSSSPTSTPSKFTTALLLASTPHSLAHTTPLAMDSSDVPTGTQPSLFNVEADEATNNHDSELNLSAEQPIPSNLNLDVDAQILEALKSKDRIYVLKLGEAFEALIKERRTRIEVTPATSYQRLLVHRCSAYYKLQPETDPSTKGLYVMLTIESRVPERRICELVPAESHTLPAFKIMKRSIPDGRSKPHSHSGSVAGEDADLSDVEPSESGSLGGQSNVAGSRKKIMTMEEREAAYNEARSRIFMGFEEKKEINSSALSISGSTSSTGRSNMGDTDDAASSPATESEWSATSTTFLREPKRDGRRGPSTSISSRTLRAGGSLHGSGSGSGSRNSRAASPSFNYAPFYEPPPSGQVYDPSQHGSNTGYHSNPYTYPYSPNQGSNHSFMAPSYPYYAPHYPYQSPPMPLNPSDNMTPPGPESYPHPQMNYVPPYGWTSHPSQPPVQLPPHTMHVPIPPQQPQHNVMHQMGAVPNMPLAPTFQPYMHPSHAYSYPMTSSYPTSPGQQAHQRPPGPGYTILQQPPPPPMYDHRATNGNPNMRPERLFSSQQYLPNVNNNSGFSGPHGGIENGVIQPGNTGRPMSNRAGNSNGNGGKNIPAPLLPRATWSYGPGVSGFPHTGGGGLSSGESVGPRFNNSNRRTSGHIGSGGNSRASSTNCDDVSSIASSSTTSSSSRRTYTSTTSSQQQQQLHPLPPRPDWAVGLKAQPTLASRHHDHAHNNSRNIPPISPPRFNEQESPGNNTTLSPRQFQSPSLSPSPSSQQQSPVTLHATDFPPLTMNMIGSEKRIPVATGAWRGSKPMLSVSSNGDSSGSQSPKGEDVVNDSTSGRPGELYVPRLNRRSVPATAATNLHSQSRSGSPQRGKDAKLDPPSILAGQMCSMTVAGNESGLAAGNPPST